MRAQPYDNPFKTQLQLEELFTIAQEMKNEGAYSSNEYLRLVGALTRDFLNLKKVEKDIAMRWDFADDPLAKVMMVLTVEAFKKENIS